MCSTRSSDSTMISEREYRKLSVPISDEGNVLVYGAAGSGTLEFLNAMAYFLIGQHSPDELQMYLLDFEAGALKAFARAPQTAEVVQGYEEKKIDRIAGLPFHGDRTEKEAVLQIRGKLSELYSEFGQHDTQYRGHAP